MSLKRSILTLGLAATAFFADIEGAPGDPPIDRALAELAFHCKEIRILGTYAQARPRG